MVQSGFWFTNVVYYMVFEFCMPWVYMWSNFLSIFGEWSNQPMIDLITVFGFPDMGVQYMNEYSPVWMFEKKEPVKPWSVDDLPKAQYNIWKLAFEDVLKQNGSKKDYITMDEFNQFITANPNEVPTEEEKARYFKQVNADGDGKITLNEFLYWMYLSYKE